MIAAINSKNNINPNSLPNIILLFFVGLIIYFISDELLYYYLYGDQFHYRRFYSAIYGETIDNIPQLQKDYLGASEPIFGVLIWIGSNLEIEKDKYISFFNSLTAIMLTRWLLLKRVNFFIILLIYTNFYFIVIMTGAERLKFSYLFILILLNKETLFKKKDDKKVEDIFNTWNLVLVGCIILSHFQSIITLIGYGALVSSKYYKAVKKYFTLGRFVIFASISTIILSYIIYNQMDAIFDKFNSYSSEKKDIVSGLVKAVGLSIIATLFSSNKREMLIMGGLISCFVFMIGGERVNMILVCLIFYAFTEENKLGHPFMIALLFYFSYKSITFIDSVYQYGDGFYEIMDDLTNN